MFNCEALEDICVRIDCIRKTYISDLENGLTHP